MRRHSWRVAEVDLQVADDISFSASFGSANVIAANPAQTPLHRIQESRKRATTASGSSRRNRQGPDHSPLDHAAHSSTHPDGYACMGRRPAFASRPGAQWKEVSLSALSSTG